jgi:hypothetical protein
MGMFNSASSSWATGALAARAVAAAGDAILRLSDSRRVLPAKVRICMLKIVSLFCRLIFCQPVKSGLAALMLGVSLLPH